MLLQIYTKNSFDLSTASYPIIHLFMGVIINKKEAMKMVNHTLYLSLSNNKRGILLALVSNGLFILCGICVRYLTDTVNVFQILLFRQLVFSLFLFPAILRNIDLLLSPNLVGFHIIRIAAAFFALILGFITVSNIPLADATALGFTKVLFVAVISVIFLKETLSRSRQYSLLAGFLGVMLVVQPSFNQLTITYTLTGLGSGLAAAVAVLCVRTVAKKEPTITLLAYQAVFVGLMALFPSIYYWHLPNPVEFTLLVLVGILSSVAQWFGVTAYKFGEANVVSNVEYTQMIYSLLLGYFLFSELPNLMSLLGSGIIITSAFLSYISAKLTQLLQNANISKNNELKH